MPTTLSDDVERESQKVRSMYESGTSYNWRDGGDPLIDTLINVNETAVDDTTKA